MTHTERRILELLGPDVIAGYHPTELSLSLLESLYAMSDRWALEHGFTWTTYQTQTGFVEHLSDLVDCLTESEVACIALEARQLVWLAALEAEAKETK